MPQLRPFRALRYDPRVVGDVGQVLCPPYDVISMADRQRLAARSDRNAVHVELPAADESSGQPAYRAAGDVFAAWQRDGTLRRDEEPLIYVYEQRFRASTGAESSARGFFCLLRLEPFGQAGVRAHERTMAGPKEDRYRLLMAVRANLSPVLLLHRPEDDGRSAARLLDRLTAAPAAVDTTTDDGIRHLLWPADPRSVPEATQLLALAAARPLTVADGHHRYETALRFSAARRQAGARGEDAADYVLVLLYDADSGGLEVLPTHRLLRGDPRGTRLLDELRRYFDVSPQPSIGDVVGALGQPGLIGVWTSEGGAVLRPERGHVEPLLPAGVSSTLRWLDVTVLAAVLPEIYGAAAHELVEQGRLAYTKDPSEAADAIQRGEADACFLLPPTPTGAVLEVAAAGEQMPHKSTYFHPKAATGLVFNLLEG